MVPRNAPIHRGAGTESETIPITTGPGESAELACPDNSKYYKWDGKPTSAQYYINPKGTPENESCQWGDGSKSVGNWAPVNLGVGFDAVSQKGYISLFPNAPTNPDGKLDFAIELVADDMSGRCKYSKGQYYFSDDYSESSPTKGCTVNAHQLLWRTPDDEILGCTQFGYSYSGAHRELSAHYFFHINHYGPSLYAHVVRSSFPPV